jgi:hypothetical protein
MLQMSLSARRIRRALLPIGAFFLVFSIHYLWLVIFPEQDPAQAKWVVLPQETSHLRNYIETQSYWLGYAYSLSIAFATVVLRRYRESRCGISRNLAVGGVTFSGLLVASGCFLIGCCGSPMLVVWLNLFGVKFLPLAKPFVAFLTTITLGAAWWWMERRTLKLPGKAEFHAKT